MESRVYKKTVSTLGKIKCSQKSVYSCILPFMFLGLRNTWGFGPLTFFALLTLFALLLSVHQWLRSAIRDSQQPTSPIGFLFLKPRRAKRRSKRRQKITRKAPCPPACGTTKETKTDTKTQQWPFSPPSQATRWSATMPRWARSEKWKWLPQHTGKKIETPTHSYTHIQFDLVWKRLLLMLNTT